MKTYKVFAMKLNEELEKEYEKRHNELWPEMERLVEQFGGQNYSTFLDPSTNSLFGSIELVEQQKWNKEAEAAVCQMWDLHMCDLVKEPMSLQTAYHKQ